MAALLKFVNCIEMDQIDNVSIGKCDDSLYIRPARMNYTQNGDARSWDLMRIHDSVSVVIFNVERKVLLFVKQFRPAVYYNRVPFEQTKKGVIDSSKYPGSLGLTVELCAGIVDKEQSLEETVRDEILEECGYNVPLSKIERVTSYRSGVGVTGSVQTLYYAEVSDAMNTHPGGGNKQEGECIEVLEMTLPEAQRLIYDETVPRPASLLFALMWFFDKKHHSRILPKL